MTKVYNLKMHRLLLSDLTLIREVDNSLKTRVFMKGLEDSIAELGVLMPLLVMQEGETDYKFSLIDGYKRLSILKKLDRNIMAVNVLIAEGSADNVSFSVNHVRGELSKLYQALYIHNILNSEKVTQDELSKRFMLSKGEISKLLSVVRHPTLVKMVKSGMTMTSAKSLAMSVTSLPTEFREKQIQNVQNAIKCDNISTRKFEKITDIVSQYLTRTKEPVEPKKIKKIFQYVESNNNFVNTDKVIKSLIDDSYVDNTQINPKRILNAFKSINDMNGYKNFKYDINNNGTVSLKLKMTAFEFRKFKKMIGTYNNIDENYFDMETEE
jgi:ParB/RepB/Spo0J family partition protein